MGNSSSSGASPAAVPSLGRPAEPPSHRYKATGILKRKHKRYYRQKGTFDLEMEIWMNHGIFTVFGPYSKDYLEPYSNVRTGPLYLNSGAQEYGFLNANSKKATIFTSQNNGPAFQYPWKGQIDLNRQTAWFTNGTHNVIELNLAPSINSSNSHQGNSVQQYAAPQQQSHRQAVPVVAGTKTTTVTKYADGSSETRTEILNPDGSKTVQVTKTVVNHTNPPARAPSQPVVARPLY